MAAKSPQIFDAAGGKIMRYQPGGSHTNSKANKIADKIIIQVLYKFLKDAVFQRWILSN